MREALANIWAPSLAGARVLDLFAGTGAVGLELLGRGAGAVTLVERSGSVLRAIRENVERLGAQDVTVRRLDLPAGLARLGPIHFDLIFADPPYAFDDYAGLLEAAVAVAAEGAEMVVEHAAERSLESTGGWHLVDHRRYGEAALSFFARPSG